MQKILKKTTFKPIWINWQNEKIAIKSEEDYQRISSKKECLYQAYGDSPIYGRDVLLYIGRTKNLKLRIEQHIETDFSRINNLCIYFGEIADGCIEGKSYKMEDLIEIAEALLITMVKPSYNSALIKDTMYKLKGIEKFIILNAENRMALPLEISNIWWDGETMNDDILQG